MTQTSQKPDPATPGDDVTFTVDVTGLTLPITITGTWDPNGSFTHTITDKASATWTETVPDDAQGGIIEGNGIKDFAIVVAP